jgi:hypothetical protein
MRKILLLIAVVLAGCASVTPTRPDQVSVSARHVSESCRPDDVTDVIAVHIKNEGATSIGFPIETTTAGAPYGLYPSAFALLSRPIGTPRFDYWKLVLDDYDLPTRLAFIGPGESADFSIPMKSWSDEDKPSEFGVRVWDTAYHPYDSAPFRLCLADPTAAPP